VHAPRQALGSFFRALIDFVDDRGVRGPVREAVSEETRALIDMPPRPMSFIPSRPIDEVESALQKLLGAEACVDCGLAAARPLGWTLLQPVLRLAFQLFGQSPASLFGNLDRFFSLVTRGISFTWESADKSGTVIARFEGSELPDAALHVLRGSLQFVFEVCSTTGTVGPPEVVESTPQATSVRYRIAWS
jgi:hypothetical protein